MITEAALDDELLWRSSGGNGIRRYSSISFPDSKEGLGVGAVEPSSSLPWTLPWRVVVVGDSAARILESDLVQDLSPSAGPGDWVGEAGARRVELVVDERQS